MKKTLIFLLITLFISTSLQAKYIRQGAIMCNSLNAILKLKKVIDTPKFWNVWGELTASKQCAEVVANMNDNGITFIDLGNGITKIENLYVFTEEVRY